jgi:hypothetical protein
VRVLLWLVRLELLRLVRTREVITFLLLPALLFVPLVAGGAIGAQSLLKRPKRVALPEVALPVALESALEDQALEVVRVADPEAALAAGEVDLAVVGWLEGEGLGERRQVESASRWRWRFLAVAADDKLEEALEEAAKDAGDGALRDWVAAAGADPDEVIQFASVTTLKPPGEPGADQELLTGVGGLTLVLTVIAALSQYLVPVVHVSDRLAGVAESLAITPAGPGRLITARLLAFTALELVAAGLLVANMQLLLSALPDYSPPSPAALVGPALGALFINAAFLLVSLGAETVQQAVTRASILLVGLAGLGVAGFLLEQPGLPFGGLFGARDPAELALAWGACGAGALLLAALTARRYTGALALPP